MTDPKIIPITLTVAHVEFGGNTGRGAYFYSFSPDLLICGKGEQGVTLRYAFCKSVPHRFKIISLLNSIRRDRSARRKLPPTAVGCRWSMPIKTGH